MPYKAEIEPDVNNLTVKMKITFDNLEELGAFWKEFADFFEKHTRDLEMMMG